jgi:hypothetical protein
MFAILGPTITSSGAITRATPEEFCPPIILIPERPEILPKLPLDSLPPTRLRPLPHYPWQRLNPWIDPAPQLPWDTWDRSFDPIPFLPNETFPEHPATVFLA